MAVSENRVLVQGAKNEHMLKILTASRSDFLQGHQNSYTDILQVLALIKMLRYHQNMWSLT